MLTREMHVYVFSSKTFIREEKCYHQSKNNIKRNNKSKSTSNALSCIIKMSFYVQMITLDRDNKM